MNTWVQYLFVLLIWCGAVAALSGIHTHFETAGEAVAAAASVVFYAAIVVSGAAFISWLILS